MFLIIRKIGILSLAKFMGGMYAAIGLIFGAIFSLAALAGAAIGSMDKGEPGAAIFGMLMGVGAVIVLPILYGVMGFVGGLIVAFVYNLLASIFGGIEFEVDMTSGAGASQSSMNPPPQQTSAFS
jgi:hypothetical protein